MSEQIKRYQHIGPLVEHSEAIFRLYPMATVYVRADDHDAALAAKDARIAGLEGLLREISNWLVCEPIATPEDMAQSFTPFREQIDNVLASQQQAEYCGIKIVEDPNMKSGTMKLVQPAAPSEDGGEVLDTDESWSAALLEVAVVLEAVSNRDSAERLANMNAGKTLGRAFGRLKSIRAQHSRIVAAKDAEIARLRELHENAHSAAKTLMAEKATLMEQAAHWLEVNAPSGGCIETNIADELRAEAEQLRAEAAVAIMPERMEPLPDDDAGRRALCAGWNAALDEVARLNRRAIPVELLKRVCLPRNTAEGWMAKADAITELRALLGKEGA